MCKEHFDFTATCAYCLRRAGEDIDVVLPVYDWKSEKLLGYFCKEHFLRVKNRNMIQYKQAN